MCKLSYRVRLWYVLTPVNAFGVFFLFCDPLYRFHAHRKDRGGRRRRREPAAISSDFCSPPHQIERTKARGTAKSASDLCSSSVAATLGVWCFSEVNPTPSNLPDVIFLLFFSFCGCFLILLHAIQADSASVLLFFHFRVSFRGVEWGGGWCFGGILSRLVTGTGTELEPEPDAMSRAARTSISLEMLLRCVLLRVISVGRQALGASIRCIAQATSLHVVLTVEPVLIIKPSAGALF